MAIITISRGSFAGGKAVAEQVAKILEHPLLSREEVLSQAAQEYGVSDKELASALNDKLPFWQQVPGKRMAYVKCVTAVLLDHCRGEKLVYHGYVGHLLLSGLPHVLRVRIIADMEQRIRSAMEQAKLGREQAISYIQNVDKQRAQWARLLYGVDWEEPSQYDLTLNLSRISTENAAQLIARLATSDDFKPTPQSLKQLEDLSLASRVWAAMARNPETRSASLNVAANDGYVVITGSVGSTRAIDMVPRVARAVEGVRGLQCEVGTGTDWYW